MGVYGNTTDHITQYGITWYFDKAYEFGKFANGDYWVLGPITLTKITPEFDGRHHGWEINPVYPNPQGFDVRINYLISTFDAKLVPSLPLQISGFKSIVKAVSEDTTVKAPRPVLKIAAVLTVVPGIPPDSGLTVFRPPYVSTDKPYYSTKNIKKELLPHFPRVGSMPTLDSMYNCFVMVQLDHKDGANGLDLRPSVNIKGGGYAPTMAMFSNDAILRLMMNDPIGQKMGLLIVMLQKGIDMYHFVLGGQIWPDGGGHQPGHLLPLAFTAEMMGNDSMKKTVAKATFFHETRLSYLGVNGSGLYGVKDPYWTEQKYWQTLATQSGSNSERDPYGYIDGGYQPAAQEIYLFCCVAQPWKGSALAFHLFPDLKKVWTNPAFFSFVDRWVQKGTYTQPDPCAPPDGICRGGANNGKPCTLAKGCPGGTCVTSMTNYGKTFGTDGKGGCIKDMDSSDGVGRFPAMNNKNADGGLRLTPYQAAMWKAYRDHPELGSTVVPPIFRPDQKNVPKSAFGSLVYPYSAISIINLQGKKIYSLNENDVRNGAWPLSRGPRGYGDGVYFFVCKEGNRTMLVPTLAFQ